VLDLPGLGNAAPPSGDAKNAEYENDDDYGTDDPDDIVHACLARFGCSKSLNRA